MLEPGIADNGADRAVELAVVMPVYNEEACIDEVLRSWLEVLSVERIDFRILVLDDGSTDGTAEALAKFAADNRVEIIRKANSGHGPTILNGYARAVSIAEWVFQCDSDNELKAGSFPTLWSARHRHDAVFGVRTGRRQSIARRLVSAGSRLVARTLAGGAVSDPNVPYRLVRSSWLGRLVPLVPKDAFAPNIILSCALSRSRARILNCPVPHEARKTGVAAIGGWKLWQGAFRAFLQTVRYLPRLRAQATGGPSAGD